MKDIHTRRVVCWLFFFFYFALYPQEEKKRRQLKEMKQGGAGCRRLCRAGRRGERREGETEGGMEPC